MTSPTKAQKDAAEAVRKYLKSKGITPEEDDTGTDGIITIEVSERDERDIANETPGAAIRARMADHTKALRELSPLVFVAEDTCDEWVNLSIRMRAKPRQPRPSEIPKLAEKVIEGLPESITSHPRVTGAHRREYRCEYDGVEVRTNIPCDIGKRKADLTWELTGSSVTGWELITHWGIHKASRPAKFKRLTPKIILAELKRITDQLDDPMRCLGYTINAKRNGYVVLVPSKSGPVNYYKHDSTERDGFTIRIPNSVADPSAVLRISDNLTSEVFERRAGETFPNQLKPLSL